LWRGLSRTGFSLSGFDSCWAATIHKIQNQRKTG
jgi:hypothetical protein